MIRREDWDRPIPYELVTPWGLRVVARYDPESDRYLQPDGTEHPIDRHRRKVMESSPAEFWGDR